ncbi:hypothetical protein A3K24_00700 [candidate division Kazan bacterium RIFCSPHIGHO2_01_FULL_44_14]|uniref:Uncharacterized protein n=1 Tax=candidate division Kazan bacterium RIFCSPLOWO2_01_FULL_45_19 TaxID=1798538 RepID=A0A1F4NPK0_UNCK3|nr:hypothetical protein [uncultured bacterium]OGB73383.1 MAG: hypothetical protein A3K51_00700 [candidate division Kazan bacterium RIFCSPLOWO2_01_FULL_45_19]OGB77628.1 MAG: hypothetical protein A3K24_00700 [candidate division Kazan bacterium RIFCSPHIGHO2_01_FULL_44_14]
MANRKISWHRKLLLKLWPWAAFRLFAKELGVANPVFDKAHEIFGDTHRIDLYPTAGTKRGFILVLDLKTALYFYQDGDHFEYDGFEMGEYDKGDVTVFDNIGEKISV